MNGIAKGFHEATNLADGKVGRAPPMSKPLMGKRRNPMNIKKLVAAVVLCAVVSSSLSTSIAVAKSKRSKTQPKKAASVTKKPAKTPAPATKLSPQAVYLSKMAIVHSDLYPSLTKVMEDYEDLKETNQNFGHKFGNWAIRHLPDNPESMSQAESQEYAKRQISEWKKTDEGKEQDKTLTALNSALLKSVATLTPKLKQVRGINPVPRSMAKADSYFTEFSFEVERYLDAVTDFVKSYDADGGGYNDYQAADERAAEHSGKALKLYKLGQEELERATDQTTKSKVYVDG